MRLDAQVEKSDEEVSSMKWKGNFWCKYYNIQFQISEEFEVEFSAHLQELSSLCENSSFGSIKIRADEIAKKLKEPPQPDICLNEKYDYSDEDIDVEASNFSKLCPQLDVDKIPLKVPRDGDW